jgi:hypothetical protein
VAPRLWPMVHLTKLDYNKFASKVVALWDDIRRHRRKKTIRESCLQQARW